MWNPVLQPIVTLGVLHPHHRMYSDYFWGSPYALQEEVVVVAFVTQAAGNVIKWT
jgi:hypothetical protein